MKLDLYKERTETEYPATIGYQGVFLVGLSGYLGQISEREALSMKRAKRRQAQPQSWVNWDDEEIERELKLWNEPSGDST